MKQFVLIVIQILFTTPLFAQGYNNYNSSSRIALVIYEKDGNGFFQKKENVSLESVSDPVSIYAFDKTKKNLYMLTNKSNCVITVDENYAKYFVKAKVYPLLKGEELSIAIEQKSKELEEKYQSLNLARQKQINDKIEKARQDSIKRAIEDSIRQVKDRDLAREYKKCHDWNWVPTKGKYLFCVICDKSVATRDSSLCYAIKKDSIYWADIIDGDIGLSYNHIHVAAVTTYLKDNLNYKYHTEVYRDSLENAIPLMSNSLATFRDYMYYDDYLEKLKKRAPNGYFLDWGWGKEYSSISFYFKYQNTNKKTIKYIDVYWVLKNAVGDIRKSGHFSGTGPLAEWESASWNWDHSNYYVAGDVSEMFLTKVIITYMDGSKVTIPKDRIWYN